MEYIVLFLTTITIFIDWVTFTFWTFHRFFRSLSFHLFCLLISLYDNDAIADQKTEIGHWESDTMIEVNHLGVLVTYMDKTSKFLVVELAKNKTASEINPCHRKTFPRDSPWQKKNLYLWQRQRILWTSRVESETRSRFLFF